MQRMIGCGVITIMAAAGAASASVIVTDFSSGSVFYDGGGAWSGSTNPLSGQLTVTGNTDGGAAFHALPAGSVDISAFVNAAGILRFQGSLGSGHTSSLTGVRFNSGSGSAGWTIDLSGLDDGIVEIPILDFNFEGGSADFSDIQSVQLFGFNNGQADFTLSSISVVPGPATALLPAAMLAAVRRRRC